MSNEKSFNLPALLAALVLCFGIVLGSAAALSFAASPASAQVNPGTLENDSAFENTPEDQEQARTISRGAGGCIAGGFASFATSLPAAGPWGAAPYGAVGCATGGYANATG